MVNFALATSWILAAYLIGSVNFGIVVSKLMGLPDPRQYGSHNPGATNVLRSGNKIAAALTLLLDFAKGLLPLLLLKIIDLDIANFGLVLAGVALAAFLGHIYPIFFKFQGGKGVATAAGVLFAVHCALGILVLVTWLVLALLSRRSSLASIFSAICAPIYYFLGQEFFAVYHVLLLFTIIVMGAFLLYRHKTNFARLIKGTEPKIGQKASDKQYTGEPQMHTGHGKHKKR